MTDLLDLCGAWEVGGGKPGPNDIGLQIWRYLNIFTGGETRERQWRRIFLLPFFLILISFL